jgi:Predicted signal transduction protein with a C-terminal ATPase domain
MKLFKNLFYGVGRQLFLFSTTIIVFLLLLVGFIFMNTTSKTLHDLAITNHNQATHQMLADFQKGVSSLINLSQNYLSNPYIQESLTTPQLNYSSRKYILDSLRYPNNNYLDYLFYIDNNGDTYASSFLAQEAAQNPHLLKLFYETTKPTYSQALLVTVSNNIDHTPDLYMARKIRHLSIDCEPGLLGFRIGSNFYQNIFSNIDMQEKCNYFLLDATFNIVYSADYSFTALDFQTVDFANRLTLESFEPYYLDGSYYFTAIDEITGFVLVSAVPKSVIQNSSNTFFKTILLILLIAIALSLFFTLIMSAHFTKPLRYLSSTLTSFSLDSLGRPIQIDTNTELDMISSGYNQMLDNIQSLLATIEDNQASLRANEYNLLLHQINPHFIYNTLFNIQMLARLNNDLPTAELISSLSNFLRIGLSKGHETLTIAEELEHAEHYMRIEQARTNSSFDFTINSSPELLNTIIPKLLLQPIIENCIKYGFANIDNHDGQIIINVTYADNKIIFSLYNNGFPIDRIIMNKLNQMPYQSLDEIKEFFPNMPGGYGIANVLCRLKLRYGDDFLMFYESLGGTTCTIAIPLSKDLDN